MTLILISHPEDEGDFDAEDAEIIIQQGNNPRSVSVDIHCCGIDYIGFEFIEHCVGKNIPNLVDRFNTELVRVEDGEDEDLLRNPPEGKFSLLLQEADIEDRSSDDVGTYFILKKIFSNQIPSGSSAVKIE